MSSAKMIRDKLVDLTKASKDEDEEEVIVTSDDDEAAAAKIKCMDLRNNNLAPRPPQKPIPSYPGSAAGTAAAQGTTKLNQMKI